MAVTLAEILAEIPEVPKCDVGHRGPDRIAQKQDCKKCRARKAYTKRVSQAQIRAGLRPRILDRTQPRVPRCRIHPKHHRGCGDCQARTRWEDQERRRLKRTGQLQPSVPVALVQEHLTKLLDKQSGGWLRSEVIARTGIGNATLYGILAGKVSRVQGATWAAISALTPRHRPAPRRNDEVAGLETSRIVRGLSAQGWTFAHMAAVMGIGNRETVSDWSLYDRGWVTTRTRDKVRLLRERLGRYDINVMRQPLPGMSKISATRAARKGWPTLAAWAGKDLTDPEAQPRRPRALTAVRDIEPETVAVTTDPFVDPVLLTLTTAAAQAVIAATADDTRWTDAHIDPIGGVTQLEMHVVVGAADRAGMTASQICALLGYPADQTDAGKRTVARALKSIRGAQQWIQEHPEGTTPSWFTPRPPTGKPDLSSMLPALIAVQPAPIGPGWSLQDLAYRCGVDLEGMAAFLRRATNTGNSSWKRRDPKQAAT